MPHYSGRYADILGDEFMKLTFKCLSADDIRARGLPTKFSLKIR